jgi:hypothetical protein
MQFLFYLFLCHFILQAFHHAGSVVDCSGDATSSISNCSSNSNSSSSNSSSNNSKVDNPAEGAGAAGGAAADLDIRLEFALPSGSYATAFLRELLCNDDLI